MPAIAFELRYPDGHWVTVYLDGAFEGAPEGTMIINRFPHVFSHLQACSSCPKEVQNNLRAYMERESGQQSLRQLERKSNDSPR